LPRRAGLQALLALAAAGLGLPAARASDGVVLTLAGKLQRPGPDGHVHLDMAALAALPQVSFRASTPWYVSAREFSGPLLRDVLALAGAQGRTLRLTALNDYRVEMPREDCERYQVILARLVDGRPIGVRDKGPLFVMYPYDSHPQLHTAVYYSRAAWQLRKIELL
jgi:hypothetical protein